MQLKWKDLEVFSTINALIEALLFFIGALILVAAPSK